MSPALDRAALRQRYEERLQLMVPAEPELLQGLSLFSGIPEKARPKVIEKVRKYLAVLELPAGEEILREGDYSDSAYFIVEGAVEVVLSETAERIAQGTVARPRGGAHVAPSRRPGARSTEGMVGRPTGQTLILSAIPADVLPGQRTILEAGEIFGELSALSRYSVSATVRAGSRVKLLQIRLPALRMLMASSKAFKAFLDTRYRERTLGRHLRNVELFSKLEDSLIERIKERADLVSFAPGEVIVQEGAPASEFFLVRGGYVKLSVQVAASDLAVTYLRKGDFVGEAALLIEEPWPFTLQALEHVELVKLPREVMREVLTPHPEIEEQLWAELVARLKTRGAVARNPVSSEYVQMAMETGLIHGESVLLIDLATCTRCDECVRGCADAHGGEPRFVREGQKYRNWLVPTACYQCTDPVCMIDCPTGAITRAAATLEVTINEPTCIGCTNCVKRCPWSNIVMVEREEKRPDGKPVEVATKCDLCLSRPEGPACVHMCPHGSAVRISFKDLQTVTETLR